MHIKITSVQREKIIVPFANWNYTHLTSDITLADVGNCIAQGAQGHQKDLNFVRTAFLTEVI